MLSVNKIRELNDRMLGLGAPSDKDDVGYNRPDWAKMEIFGRYLGEYTDWQLMTMLEALSHYTNTQLSEYKDEITESLKELKAKNPEYSPLTAKPGANYIPVGIYLDEIQKSGATSLAECLIHLHVPTTDFSVINACNSISKKAFADGKGGYRCRATRGDSNIQIYVKPDCYTALIEELATTGNYGYKPKDYNEKKLLEFVEKATAPAIKAEIKSDSTIQPVMSENPTKLVKIVKTDISGVVIYFDGYVNDVNMLKNSVEGLRSLKIKDKWHTFVPFEGADKVCAALVKNGYENVLPQIVAEAKKTEEKLANWNSSGKSLADLSKFDLPFAPYPFQVEDASNLVTKKRMLIGHDMGCGKTFIAGLVGYSIPGRKLVIVPESLRLNWQREMKAINKSADIVVLRNEDIKKNGLTFGKDWTIIGYSTAVKYKDEILKQDYVGVFIDEAHRCKAVNNSGKPTSKRAEAVLDICEKAEHCYPMTGTPIPTSNKDIFNLFKMLKIPEVDHGRYSTFFQFGLRFCNGYNNGFGYDFTGSSNSEELNQLLGKNMVRRLKKDVLPNLKKQRVFIPVEIKSKEYDDIEKRLQAAANGNGMPGDTFLGLAMTGRAVMSAKKVESSIDLADSILDSGKSVVIVSEFNETLDKIVEHYKGDCCCIRGGMSDKAKQDAVDSFQSGKCKVCALNTIAGGVGITLTKASDMIVCDYDWTPANMDQVEDRINRSGQKEDCSMIHYLYNEKSTLDTLFMDMITKKSENINRVVDNAENTMKFVKDRDSAEDFIRLLKKVYQDRSARPSKTEVPEVTERE